MLYEMLTGVQLFAAMNAAEMAQLAAPIPDVHEINPAVPADLSAIVAQCLEYEPARRYQSFDDLHAALSRVSETLPGKLSIPTDDQHAARAALMTPSLEILSETYSLISLGRYEDAAACAQRGIDIDPTNHEHWVNGGKALGEIKSFPAAQQCCLRATELRPRDAQVWANLAWVTLVMGDAATALSQAKYATRARHDVKATGAQTRIGPSPFSEPGFPIAPLRRAKPSRLRPGYASPTRPEVE
jgi:Flp pilus assembly protein TadD